MQADAAKVTPENRIRTRCERALCEHDWCSAMFGG